MQKRYKKLIACALVLLLGLTCAVSPVYATEETSTNTETVELQEIDETAVPISGTEGTKVEGGTDTEESETEETTDTEKNETEETTDTEKSETEETTDTEESETEETTDTENSEEEAITATEKVTENQNTKTENQISLFSAPQRAVPMANNEPVNINNADDLIDFATKINNGTYSADTNAILTDNIDMSGKTYTPIGALGADNEYSGTFDGNGFEVQNLKISLTINCAGLFGIVDGATIKNVGVTGEIKTTGLFAGGIVAYAYNNPTIENCWNKASITASGYYTGGIAGYFEGTITNCYNTGTVTAEVQVGGIAGYIKGTITNCYNTGKITANNSYAGGIAGRSYSSNSTITNCYNTGTVSSYYDSPGGIVGKNSGTITNCYYLSDSSSSAGGGISKMETEFKSGEVTWLLNGSTSEGVWKQTLGEDDYPNFTGLVVYYDSNYYNVIPAPKPEFTTSLTASSITVTLANYTADYGDTQYSLNGSDWQVSNVFDNLKANQSYTVYVKYAGTGNYLESDTAEKSVTTASASYTISIPSTPLTAGETNSGITISADTSESFDLGYGGKVIVNVKNGENVSSDGKLTLTRNGATNTITSTLLVNGSEFTNIENPIITFTMSDYNLPDKKVIISFAKPTETNIPAGDYKGTVTFEVSYSED